MVQGNSHNIPQHHATMQSRNQQYAQPKKQEKALCKVGIVDYKIVHTDILTHKM